MYIYKNSVGIFEMRQRVEFLEVAPFSTKKNKLKKYENYVHALSAKYKNKKKEKKNETPNCLKLLTKHKTNMKIVNIFS